MSFRVRCEFLTVFLRVLPFDPKVYMVVHVDGFFLFTKSTVVIILVSGLGLVRTFLRFGHGVLEPVLPFLLEVSVWLFT